MYQVCSQMQVKDIIKNHIAAFKFEGSFPLFNISY
jgi:hypothetical protein